MAIIISLYATILAFAIWQEDAGSDHVEADLGSERGPCKPPQ